MSDRNNLIQNLSFEFALRVIQLSNLLNGNKEFIFAQQILRSGTSVGANIEEALGAQSKKEFVSKLSISYKEARETLYWLKLLKLSNKIEPKLADSLIKEINSIIKILAKIRITSLKRMEK